LNFGCEGGSPKNTYNYIKSNGLTTEANYPYIAKESGSCKINSGDAKVIDYEYVAINPELIEKQNKFERGRKAKRDEKKNNKKDG